RINTGVRGDPHRPGRSGPADARAGRDGPADGRPARSAWAVATAPVAVRSLVVPGGAWRLRKFALSAPAGGGSGGGEVQGDRRAGGGGAAASGCRWHNYRHRQRTVAAVMVRPAVHAAVGLRAEHAVVLARADADRGVRPDAALAAPIGHVLA